MAYFAELNENNIVVQIVAVNNNDCNNEPFPNSEPIGVSFLNSLFSPEKIWRQTSYNNTFRKNYAGVGFTYDAILDAFIPPQPYPSWQLNINTCQWDPPIPYPNNGKIYRWDESTQSWDLVDVPAA